MKNSPLVFLVYMSRIKCSRAEIERIAEQSVTNNTVARMTGALMNDATHFLQFLEGPATAAGETMLRIMADRRHDDIRPLVCEPTQTRLFSNWHMKHVTIRRSERTISGEVEKLLRKPQTDRGLLLQRLALELDSGGSTASGQASA